MKIVEIQRLRAIAMCMVLLGHMPIALPNYLMHGYTGVTIFFVLSGYLAAYTYYANYEDELAGGVTPAKFLLSQYINKFFRVVMIAVTGFLVSFLIAQIINNTGGAAGTTDKWVCSAKWLFSGAYNYFFGMDGGPDVVGHYWSLAVELHFYMLFPILFMLFRRPKARIALCVVVICLVATIARPNTPETLIGIATHTQLDALFSGMLVGILQHEGLILAKERTRCPVQARVVFWMDIVLLMYAPYKMDGVLPGTTKFAIYVPLCVILLLLVLRYEGIAFGGRNPAAALFAYLGNRSYSIYIIHVVLYSGVYYNIYIKYENYLPDILRHGAVAVLIQTLALFALALAGGILFYHLFEKPYSTYAKSLKLRRKGELHGSGT